MEVRTITTNKERHPYRITDVLFGSLLETFIKESDAGEIIVLHFLGNIKQLWKRFYTITAKNGCFNFTVLITA